jgi:hypothetical protein
MQENLPAIRAQDTAPLRVIDNPYYEPDYAPAADMPVIETDFSKLRTPKSDLAKEIAAEAVGAPEFVQSLKEKKRGASNSVTRINPYDLSVEPDFNVRDFTTPDMQKRVWELSQSVATIGVEKAILVYFTNNKLCVQCGETRLRATLTAIELRGATNVRSVPIMFGVAGENDRDRYFRQWTDNDQHQPTHLEQGLLIKKMLRFAVGEEEAEIRKIAARIGKPVVYIRTLLATQELPEEIQGHIRAGRMKPAFARSIWAKSNQHLPTAISLIEDMLVESGNTRIMPRHLPRPEGKDAPGKRSTTTGRGATGTSRPATRGTVETETETVNDGGTGPGLDERRTLADEPTMLAKLMQACTIVLGEDGMELFRPASIEDAEMIKILASLHGEHETLQQVSGETEITAATGALTDDTTKEDVEVVEFVYAEEDAEGGDDTAVGETGEEQESVAAHG